MTDLSKFIDSYLPDNHWLSKSMEVGRLDYGTYWYMKKMMVYYYYIFILKKMERKEISEIKENFNEFIDSLPKEAKKEAEDFFFKVDIRNEKSIITFNEFTMNSGFIDNGDLLKARKYYYSYLMGLNPQNEVKELIFSSIISERNFFKGREKARLKLMVTKNENAIKQLESDVHAFLRNERQILFIMGLLNYTDTNEEEYSPTGIGIQAVNANFNEFILLIELQKLKQVSRNPLVYYANSTNRPRNRRFKDNIDTSIIDNFDIKLHPYLLYLKYLSKQKAVSNNEFRYLLSRSTDRHDEDYIIKFPKAEISNLKDKINEVDGDYIVPGNNNYNQDIIRGEDFSKEHKKYQLGITASEKDYNGNLFAVCKRNNLGIKLSEENKLNSLIDYYQEIINYLDQEDDNVELFEELKRGHKQKYLKHITKNSFKKDSHEHIQLITKWLEYFVSVDRNVIKMMILAVSKANNLTDDEIYDYFPNLCNRCLGYKNSKNISKKLSEKEDVHNNSYNFTPIIIPGLVTIKDLKEESKKYLDLKNDFRKDRVRNTALISMYLKWYQSTEEDCVCEICGEKLARKDNDDLICNVHHMIPFKENEAYGPDHYLNLLALCGTCHQNIHNIKNVTRLQEMYEKVETTSALKKSVKQRIIEMYEEDYLYPTSLRYATVKGMITPEEEKQIIKGK